MTILLTIFWLLTILFTLNNSYKALYRVSLPAEHIILQAVGITGLIFMYFVKGG